MELVGRVSLTLDAHIDRSTLAVQTWHPTVIALPQERLRLDMDRCTVQGPVPRESGVLRPATARASCDGREVELGEIAPGAWSAVLEPALPVGSRCEVELDGETLALPELIAWPDVEPSFFRAIRWTAGDADELRVVVPLPDGRLSTCRLADDGRGKRPRELLRHTAFVARQVYALPDTEAGRVAVSVASGTWLRRGRATTSR